MQVCIGPVLEEGRLKSIKTIYHLIRLEFENLCFVFVASTVWVSRVFVYNAVNINKIVIVSSTKPPSYAYAQVTARLKLNLVDLPIHGEYCKPNSNFVD